jgi:puromycin-sensitive aminopeptidase
MMPPTSSTSTSDTAEAYRLPRNAEPLAYRIEIEPDVGSASFSGTVAIDLTIHEPLQAFVLNAVDLAISDVEVRTESGQALGCSVSFNDELEQVTFTAPAELPPGPCTLTCRFTGTLNDKLRGFYRSTFTDDKGDSHTIATTQFESVDARRAFPCWDEPDRKATFEVTLIVERDVEAFSNSPIADVQRVGDKNRVRFAPTMKMSTYLVAFVVGKLETTETVDVDGVPLRVVFTPGKRGLADFALAIGAFSLRYFAAGAMENLGCITFRDTALLIDPATAARAELERVADVVAHELAHMWFGDLVTMGWWEGIWLNEAFATFMETLAVDAFRPSWDRWVGFAPSREAALAIDGVHATRPIEFPVGLPVEAEGMFDLLTYEKGCAVLRMLEQHIGPEVFRDGVRAYLKEHAYANTVTTDLWDALEDASGAPVRDVMNTFILQGGHPLVSLTDGSLSQQPFSYGPAPADIESAIGETWNVPVAVRSLGSADSTRKLVLGPDPVTLPRGDAGLTVVNAGGWGVFRVGYSRQHRLDLADRLSELTPLERANLLADTWATTLAGHSGLEEFLVLGAKLGLEADPTPWAPVGSAVMLANRILKDDDRPALRQAVTALVGPLHQHLGFEASTGEGERTPTLRSLAINLLGTVGADHAVRAEASARFDAAPIGGGTGPAIPADVEAATLAVVAQLLRDGDYDRILARYRAASTPQEEMRSLTALTLFPDVALAERTFDLSMTEVRSQNGWVVIGALLNNPAAGAAIWDRVTGAWDTIFERFPKAAHARIIEGIPGLCADAGLAERVVEFLHEHPVASGPRRVSQSIERLGVNVAFAARERDRMGQAFDAALAAAAVRPS